MFKAAFARAQEILRHGRGFQFLLTLETGEKLICLPPDDAAIEAPKDGILVVEIDDGTFAAIPASRIVMFQILEV